MVLFNKTINQRVRIIVKRTFITTVLTAVKKINNQHTRPAGPGRLRSWSGPVDPEFQGRLRFSYDSRPAVGPLGFIEFYRSLNILASAGG